MPRDCRNVLVEFEFRSTLNDCEPGALLSLARRVWRINVAAGITGEMRLRGGRVRQVVEGSMETVLPMAARILADPRHTRIEVIALGELAARRHSEWRVHGLPAASVRGADPARSPDADAVDMARRRFAQGWSF